MQLQGPVSKCASECERILRTLPLWFGIDESLLQYASDSEVFPTFVARDGLEVVGFITLRRHFPEAWEVHCIAVQALRRAQGVGRKLQAAAESWLLEQGAKVLQVKTLAPSHPSIEYAQTREFYKRLGYVQIEVFPELWGKELPVLQLLKVLKSAA